jgi:anthranilate synthase/aminodeoxychorismate synthase-like glutamine amidotransferase
MPTHGKPSLVYHDGRTVYAGLANPFEAGRYHSLVVAAEGFPDELEKTARTSDDVIMGVRHRQYAVEGVQFHPESIMTDAGHAILRNFLGNRQPVWSQEARHG